MGAKRPMSTVAHYVQNFKGENMGIESRDWYRDYHRKAQGYIERAAFRVALGHPDKQKPTQRPVWAFWLYAALACLLSIAVVGCVSDMLQ